MTAAYVIGAAGTDFRLEWNNNVARDLIAAADFITWNNDAQTLLNTQEFPVPIAVAKLGTCNAAKIGQRRYVNDATAPAYGVALVTGGAIPAIGICDGVSAWLAH
jgi:hypothetical protein